MADRIHDHTVSPDATAASTPISRDRLLRGAGALGVGVAGASLLPVGALGRSVALAEGPHATPATIEVWYPYSGTTATPFLQVLNAFQQSHPTITLKATYASNDLSSNQKLFAAVSAGLPPDVTWVDGPEVAGWGVRGILQPLDAYVEKAGLKASDFWAPAWQQLLYNGHTWALPFTADPNFGFFYNKQLFNAAGIKEPPKTFDEMNRMAQELTIVKGGNVQQIGLLPWNVYGNANSMVTWGWVFGGSFYTQATNKVTANDPRVVAALEWMVSYAKKYGITKIASFTAPFGAGGLISRMGRCSPSGRWPCSRWGLGRSTPSNSSTRACNTGSPRCPPTRPYRRRPGSAGGVSASRRGRRTPRQPGSLSGGSARPTTGRPRPAPPSATSRATSPRRFSRGSSPAPSSSSTPSCSPRSTIVQ